MESYAASTHDNASLIRKSRPSRTCADDWKLYGKEEEEEEEEVNPSGGELEMDEVEPMQHMDGGGAGLADLDDKEIEQVYPRESARSFDLSATVACTHTISCFGFSDLERIIEPHLASVLACKSQRRPQTHSNGSPRHNH